MPVLPDAPFDTVRYGPDIPTETELRLLGHVAGKRVLELGCGTGDVAITLAKQGARVIAVDESLAQVAHARRLAEAEEVKLELHQGDLADLAFVRADTIDLAVSVYTLSTVDDIDRVFRQVHRVLRPESPFVISLPHPSYRAIDPDSDPPRLRHTYFDRAPVPAATGPGEGEEPEEHPRTLSELFTSLVRANFRIDTLLEPEPARGEPRSRHWTPAMAWMPSTLILRARKEGI